MAEGNSTGKTEREKAQGWFASTQWSVVLAAGGVSPEQRPAALEQLCRTYWFPLYAYVRRRGHTAEDAQDLTQEFFARLLEKRWLDRVENNGSRFRSFLLSALNAFLANEYDRATAAKRGGGRQPIPLDGDDPERRYALEPASNESPERVFDRRWAWTVLDRAWARLKTETTAAGKAHHFEVLNPFLASEPEPGEYGRAASQLNVSPGAVAVSVHRLRHRYRELVRGEIGETVADPAQIESEMSELLAALRG